MISPALPSIGLELNPGATPVKPAFTVVEATVGAKGSPLIIGDATDYELVRSRIDDHRMLKGFLQVALGAESAEAWSAIPDGMAVHRSGVLALRRNAFLQPEAVVDQLDDHRGEVRDRADEPAALLAELRTAPVAASDLADFVSHRETQFNPASCASRSIFTCYRQELRTAQHPTALLIELGVWPGTRGELVNFTASRPPPPQAPETFKSPVRARRRRRGRHAPADCIRLHGEPLKDGPTMITTIANGTNHAHHRSNHRLSRCALRAIGLAAATTDEQEPRT